MQHSTFARWVPWLLFPLYAFALLVIAQLTAPFPQPDAYHALADSRTLFGVPFFADVVSNLAILVPALMGCVLSLRGDAHTRFSSGFEHVLAVLFFITLTATALGSTWYHLAPDNQRLLFDRLPIGLAFTTLIAWLIAERTWLRASGFLAMLPWILLGPLAVLWWYSAHSPFPGDLRAYLLLYVFVFVLTPLLLWLPSSYSHARGWWWAYVLFALGMVGDRLDHPVFNALNGLVSGHTLKHLLTGLALAALVRMLAKRRLRFR